MDITTYRGYQIAPSSEDGRVDIFDAWAEFICSVPEGEERRTVDDWMNSR